MKNQAESKHTIDQENFDNFAVETNRENFTRNFMSLHICKKKKQSKIELKYAEIQEPSDLVHCNSFYDFCSSDSIKVICQKYGEASTFDLIWGLYMNIPF